MTATLLAIGVGLVLGFALGRWWRAERLARLGFVADFLGEEVEAVHGADLDADVAAERALRMPQRQPADDLDVPAFMADSGYRAPTVGCPDGGPCTYLSRGMAPCDDQCAVSLADDDEARQFLADIRERDHLGQLCGWSEDGTTTCGEPAEGWARWPDGEPTWLCGVHMAWMREGVEDGSGGTLPRSLPGRGD